MKRGRKAITNNGLHSLPDGSEIVLIGMDYDDEYDEIFLFRSQSGIVHHLHLSEFNWMEEEMKV